MEGELLSQGAEGRLYKTTFLGKPCLAKERFKKQYRHPTLDEKLTSRRLTQESRILAKCRTLGVSTPTVYFVDQGRATIYMEYLKDTIQLKEFIDTHNTSGDISSLTPVKELCYKVGSQIATFHSGDVIHGDLTSSNILIRTSRDHRHVIFIDFGLAGTTTLVEDKGVDLYVLEKAFLSSHPNSQWLVDEILRGYKMSYKDSKTVLDRLAEIRLRGRKRSMVG